MGHNVATVWMGNVRPHMDENYIRSMLFAEPELRNIKTVRDKITGFSAAYCFLEFTSHEAAQSFMERTQGRPMPSGDGLFRLNWASKDQSTMTPTAPSGREEPTGMFIGDVAPEVSETVLFQLIQHHFPAVQNVKLNIEPGRAGNYGFVKFASETDRDNAITIFNGYQLGSKALRCSVSVQKHAGSSYQSASYQSASYQSTPYQSGPPNAYYNQGYTGYGNVPVQSYAPVSYSGYASGYGQPSYAANTYANAAYSAAPVVAPSLAFSPSNPYAQQYGYTNTSSHVGGYQTAGSGGVGGSGIGAIPLEKSSENVPDMSRTVDVAAENKAFMAKTRIHF